MLGQPVPGFVLNGIDDHLKKKQLDYAWNAIADAINAYQDPKLHIYNCLWLYYKGAIVASQQDNYEWGIGMATKFIGMAEKLTNMGTHMQKVQLDAARITPPRQYEIDEMKGILAKLEEGFRRQQLALGKSTDVIAGEVSKFKGALAQKSGGCLMTLVGVILVIALWALSWL